MVTLYHLTLKKLISVLREPPQAGGRVLGNCPVCPCFNQALTTVFLWVLHTKENLNLLNSGRNLCQSLKSLGSTKLSKTEEKISIKNNTLEVHQVLEHQTMWLSDLCSSDECPKGCGDVGTNNIYCTLNCQRRTSNAKELWQAGSLIWPYFWHNTASQRCPKHCATCICHRLTFFLSPQLKSCLKLHNFE